MKKLGITLAIFGIVLQTSCNLGFSHGPLQKDPPGGHVLEYGTLQPIPGASVYLSDCTGEILGSLNCTTIDSTSSDNDGGYAFTQTGFQTNAYKGGYFTDFTTAAQVLGGSEDKADIILLPYAWLKVTIRNESGAYAFNTDVFDSTHPFIYLSLNADTTLVTLVKGNQEYKFGYCIRPNPDTLTGCTWVPIYCPGHDTTSISITY